MPNRKKKNQPEKLISNAIIDYLQLVPGCIVMPIDTVGMWDPTQRKFRKKKPNKGRVFYTGVADILVHHDKLGLIAIEVKSETGVLSKVQKEFRDTLVATNGRHIVARSVTEVAAYFEVCLKTSSLSL